MGTRAGRLSAFPCLAMDMAPSLRKALPHVFWNHAERRVMEFDDSATDFFAQPVLHV